MKTLEYILMGWGGSGARNESINFAKQKNKYGAEKNTNAASILFLFFFIFVIHVEPELVHTSH